MNENVDDVADEYSRTKGKTSVYRGNRTFRARNVSLQNRVNFTLETRKRVIGK